MADTETEIHVETTEDTRPDWLPSNFQKPEDLVKSYTHATQKITEQGQKLSALESRLEEIQSSQTQRQEQQYSNDLEQQLIEAYESGDGRAIAAANAFLIQQALAPVTQKIESISIPAPVPTELVADYARRTVAGRFSDWDETEPKIAEVIQANPILQQMVGDTANPKGIADALETAYKLAKYETGQTVQTQAAEQLGELARQVKNQAQTMTGTNSATEQKSYWDMVAEQPVGIPPVRL